MFWKPISASPRRPTVHDVYEHYTKAVVVDPRDAWAGRIDEANLQLCIGDDDASSIIRAAEDGAYVDVHVWVFTDDTFVELIRYFIDLNLLALDIARVVPTPRNSLEFFITLRKLSRVEMK